MALVVVGGGVWTGAAVFDGHARTSTPAAPSVSPAPAGPTGPAGPSGPVSLAGWQLSVPLLSKHGDATTLDPATFDAPWLTEDTTGGLAFFAPTTGATTKHSEHPRTELDSLTTFPAGTGSHTLTATVTLLQVPADGEGIIVGQIHGADAISAYPFVMLRYQDQTLRVVVKQTPDGTALIDYPLLDGVALGSPFTFTLTDPGTGSLTFSATHDGVTKQAEAPVPAAFEGRPVRFQAGDYQQAKVPAGGQDGGRVVFSRLDQESTGP